MPNCRQKEFVDRKSLLQLEDLQLSILPETNLWVRRSSRMVASFQQEDKLVQLRCSLEDESSESWLEVFVDPSKGRSIRSLRCFEESDFVAEYKGKLIDGRSAKRREKLYSQDPSAGCYMYYFKHGGQSWCIDATEESDEKGRLINHSKRDPNLHTKVVHTDSIHLIFLAARNITAGEELLYDYGDRSLHAVQNQPWLLK